MLPPSLTPVDPEMLKSRLISSGPGVLQRDPDALVFTPQTFTQLRQSSTPKPMRQELLVRHEQQYLILCPVIVVYLLFCIPAGSETASQTKTAGGF